MWSWLEKERTVAPPDYSRWMVPPAALCIHLCIGMAYGFSVFWLPMTRLVGITESKPWPADYAFVAKLYSTSYDWDKPVLGWIYTLFFVFLGCSAACFGPWLERAGPRKAGVVAAGCWSGGLVVAALGVYLHQLWLVWLGLGVIGGIGLGLGYISPVSTLIKWFPDRRGLATGMAIMGFGGGAMIGSPLADRLMTWFASPDSVGVWETFLVLAVIYFIFMMLGAWAYRLPPAGWRPAGRRTAQPGQSERIDWARADRFVTPGDAVQTKSFWLLWLVLCLNVSAGIGVIGMASPLLQEIFGGRLIGSDLSFERLDASQLRAIAAVGAGFTGLLSLFNIAGRFFWASASDYLGRKTTYALFFLLGAIAYAAVPAVGQSGNIRLFVAVFCFILTMYGGGFATIPAYLSDLFGTHMVGAIHGRLLTAWSVAGILGPVLVNYWNAYQIAAGVPRGSAYDQTLYILAGLLVLGFFCNLGIRSLPDQIFVTVPPAAHAPSPATRPDIKPVSALTEEPLGSEPGTLSGSQRRLLIAFWLLVLLPMAWGAWMTLKQTGVLLLGPG